jgi:uncharacterized protein (TIGR02246 family)
VSAAADRAAILRRLDEQVAAWNRGDIEAFCEVCAPDVAYLTADGVVEGRAALIEAYRAKYPDRAAMGTLTLSVDRLDVHAEVALAHGRWTVGPHGGRAMLAFTLRSGEWFLSWDATFRAAPTA